MVLSAENTSSKDIATILLFVCEGLVILLMTLAFWYDNTIRPMWFWLFWLAIPIFILRWRLTGRLWTHTILHDVLIVFILLTAFNYNTALFQKESYLAATARPLSGIWTFVYFVELTRISKRLDFVIILVLGMSIALGFIALTTSQWLDEKTGFLWVFIDYLPRVDYRLLADRADKVLCSPIVKVVQASGCFTFSDVIRRGFFSFNVNEIAGALVWVAPVLAGFAMTPISSQKSSMIRMPDQAWTLIRIIAGIGFGITLIALIFGQSRFAMFGLIISLAILIWGAIKNTRLRIIMLSCVALLIVLQSLLFFNVWTPTETQDTASTTIGISSRDESSVSTRLQIWDRGLSMMTDYPMTGVGMYMFRTAVNQNPYIIPYFSERNIPPPHAHNEWFHIGAEMGLLGLLVFCGIQGAILWMIWTGWQDNDPIIRMIALSAFVGLLAHAIYGIGDTIALWDRFQFVFWWLVGLVGAQYVLGKSQKDDAKLDNVVIRKIS